MKKSITAICLAASVVIALSGCQNKPAATTDKDAAAESQKSAGETTGEDASADSEDDETDMDLYNGYVEVYNLITGQMVESLNSYFKYVPNQAEFAPVDPEYWCLSVSSYELESLENTNTLIAAKSEKTDLDRSFEALYPVIKDLAGAINEVADYTDMKSYADDDYAKGKELHARIIADYPQYETLSSSYLSAADPFFAAEDEKSLQKFKDNGQDMSYALNVAMSTAQDIQAAIYNQNIYDGAILTLDTAALQPLYEQYIKDLDACTAVYGQPDKLAKETFDPESPYLEQCISAMKDAKVSLTDIFKRVADQTPLEDYELNSAFAADGTIAKFDENVSAMIDAYNQLVSY